MALSSHQFCDTCGAANREQAQFCRVCGHSLRIPVAAVAETRSFTLTGLLTPQAMLKQRYILLGQAGKGGFGAVYKAMDTQMGNRLVAIKEMSQNSLNAQELLTATESFKQEALLLASLTHPNLPRIYEQFTESGRSYLVMDFIDGETLEAHLRGLGEKRMPIEKVLDISLQLCSVLDYLHTRQPPIIFRDLKPANVMLTPSGHVYLIDFGIARLFKPGQKNDTTALGSSGYAPPEQYGKSQTTIRADIYSLGATLHQLLTGDDPSDSPFRFTPLQFSDATLSGLDTLVMSMVNVAVDKRPASVAIVQQMLQRVATHYTLRQGSALTGNNATLLPGMFHVNQQGAGIPANPYQQAPTSQPPTTPTTKKKSSRQISQPQVYPQANTLYICLGHSTRITALAWSPDGTYLASASYDKTVKVWNAKDGSPVLTYQGHSARVNSLSWSPDSKQLASGSDDHTVQIWEAASGKAIFTYHGHNSAVEAVAWSPDGAHIASAGQDKTVQVWHASTHATVQTYRDHTDIVQALAWSPDGAALASAGKDRVVRLWEPLKPPQKRSLLSTLLFPQQGQRTLTGYEGQINALAWSPDNKRLAAASGDYRVRVREVHTHHKPWVLETDSSTIKNSVAWSPNGKHLAVGGNDKIVRIWNVTTKKDTFAYHGHTGYVMAVAWSPDGTRVASAGVDRTVQVWQAV